MSSGEGRKGANRLPSPPASGRIFLSRWQLAGWNRPSAAYDPQPGAQLEYGTAATLQQRSSAAKEAALQRRNGEKNLLQ